jgi:hypothetical protein
MNSENKNKIPLKKYLKFIKCSMYLNEYLNFCARLRNFITEEILLAHKLYLICIPTW